MIFTSSELSGGDVPSVGVADTSAPDAPAGVTSRVGLGAATQADPRRTAASTAIATRPRPLGVSARASAAIILRSALVSGQLEPAYAARYSRKSWSFAIVVATFSYLCRAAESAAAFRRSKLCRAALSATRRPEDQI